MLVTPSTDELFSRVVDVMRNSPALEDSEIVTRLVDNGVEPVYAKRLVEFVPIAYCRLLMANTGARFSSYFCRKFKDGNISSEQLFSSEPLWNAAVGFAKREIARGIPAAHLLFVAGRSPEFEAANKLLEKGSHLENVAFTPPILKAP
jgi:hypothetical protein